MVEGTSAGRRRDGTRCARIARVAVLLVATAALAAPAPAFARDPDRGRELRDAYPLPTASGRAAGPAVANDAAAEAPSAEMASAPSDDVERLALASILALIAGGATTWLVSLRWPRLRAVSVAAITAVPDTAPVRSFAPELWVHGAGAPVAEPATPALLEEPPAAASPPPPPPAPSPGGPAPPEPDRAWAAEIGWHLVDGESQFRVTARPVDGATEPITLRASSPVEWPPGGARSVQALTDAVKSLESTLVTAGWTPLPRGSAWYAKRFTWQPGARPRAVPATAGRTRHRNLYDAEYARQIDRTQRLRRTVNTRLVAQGDADTTGTAPE
jgi:hypothetical protein